MKQPDLGLKVTELRKQKGLTQEMLAEKCEVSTRTIQRIETGEVDPRVYTLQYLSESLGFNFMEDYTSYENLWLVALHLSNIFCIIIIPLLLWSWKKDQSFKIDKQGRLVLNFQITMTLLLVGSLFGMAIVLPTLILLEAELGPGGAEKTMILAGIASLTVLPFIAIGMFAFYQAIANTMRASAGKCVHYPLSIQFLK
jgi:uncharacterized Tic20 family protein/DNA-binding Xre family transcriptional regulator